MTQSLTNDVSRLLTHIVFYYPRSRNHDAAHVNQMIEGRNYERN
jgi:hypothetical protein